MICRKQNIRPDADEISMMLSLGVPDVHRRFNRLYDELSVYPGATKIPFTEEELKVAEDNNTLIRKIYNIGLIDATNTMMR